MFAASRDAKVLKQAQEPSQFETPIRIRQECARIRAGLSRFKKAGVLPGTEASWSSHW